MLVLPQASQKPAYSISLVYYSWVGCSHPLSIVFSNSDFFKLNSLIGSKENQKGGDVLHVFYLLS